METSFKLMLLNGPLQGQELHLPLGTFTLGTGDCDLRLPLEQSAKAKLEVTHDAVILCSETPCWVSGRHQSKGMLPMHLGIDLAGVHFMLARKEEAPPIPNIARRHNKANFLQSILLSSLLLSAGVAILLWSTWPALPLSPHDWLPAALRTEPGIRANWKSHNILELSGRCRASHRMIMLTERLRAAGVHLIQEAICDDDLLRSIRLLLANYGYPNMKVTLDERRKAHIDGDFQGDTRVLALALDKLPGLQSWKLSDHGTLELETLIMSLKREGLLNGLSASHIEHTWLLSGLLPPKQQARLEALLKNLNLNPQNCPIRFISSGTAGHVADIDYLPAPMAGIGGNTDTPYLLLTNGMRLLPGTPVKEGMRVISIDPTGITLAGRQRLVFLPLHS